MDHNQLLRLEIIRLNMKLESSEEVRDKSDFKLKLKVRTLQDINQGLELKLALANKELIKKSKISQDNFAYLEMQNTEHESAIVAQDEKLRTMIAKHTYQLESNEEMHTRTVDQTVAQQTLTHEADKLEMTADFNRQKGEMEVTHQKQMEEVVSTLKDELKQLEAEGQAAEVNHTNKLMELQQEKKKNEDNANIEIRVLKREYREVEKVNNDLREENSILCKRGQELVNMDLLKKENMDLILIGGTNEKTICDLKKEIQYLKPSLKKLQSSLQEERNSYAILKTKEDLNCNVKKDQGFKIRRMQLELKKEKEAKQEADAINFELTMTISTHEDRQRSLDAENKKFRQDIQAVQHDYMKFRARIEDCFDETSNNKEFQKIMIEFKRHYMDDVKPTTKACVKRYQEEKKNESVFKAQVTKVLKNMNNWRKGVNKQAENERMRLQKTQSEYRTMMSEHLQLRDQKMAEKKVDAAPADLPGKGTYIHVKPYVMKAQSVHSVHSVLIDGRSLP